MYWKHESCSLIKSRFFSNIVIKKIFSFQFSVLSLVQSCLVSCNLISKIFVYTGLVPITYCIHYVVFTNCLQEEMAKEQCWSHQYFLLPTVCLQDSLIWSEFGRMKRGNSLAYVFVVFGFRNVLISFVEQKSSNGSTQVLLPIIQYFFFQLIWKTLDVVRESLGIFWFLFLSVC